VNEKPIAESLVICDHIITEAGTNKKSLIGIFNSLASTNFPVQHPKLCVYAAMSNGRGEMVVDLRCVRMKDSKEVFKLSGTLQFPDPNAVIELVANLNQFPFEQDGLYSFELVCEDEILLEKRFNVLLVSQPPPGQMPRQ
jgi:hypothetical protein